MKPDFLSAVPAASHSATVRRLDPRTRVAAAVVFAFEAAVLQTFPAATAACAAALVAVAIERPSWRRLTTRLAPVNLFLLVLLLLLPFSTPGRVLFRAGPLTASMEGGRQALLVLLKANAIVVWCAVFLDTMDPATFGRALHRLGVPMRLVHLLLFTVRYIDVLRREYNRLHQAMRVRGFRPRTNLHTYRSYGYLVGMLLVRSVDRSERILAAMKCRGFRGEYYVLDRSCFTRRDAWFFALLGGIAIGLLFLEIA